MAELKELNFDDLPELTFDEPQPNTQGQQPQQGVLQQPNQQVDMGKLLAILAGGGAAYAGYQGGIVPATQRGFQQQIGKEQVVGSLENIQRNLGIPNEAGFKRIPQKITEISKNIKSEQSIQENRLKYEFDQSLRNSKSALEDFNNKIVAPKVEDLVTTLKEAKPIFRANAMRGYEQGKIAIENYLQDKGVKFTGLDFDKVLDNTIQRAISEGVLPQELQPLQSLREFLTPNIDPKTGLMAEEKPMAFKQMRGYVSAITKDYKTSKIAPYLNEEWLNYLSQKLPDEAPVLKEQMNKMIADYKQFSMVDRELNKIVGTSGEFNKDAANKFALKYLKSQIDTGADEMINLLAKGNDLVEGVAQVEAKFNALKELKPQSQALTKQITIQPQLKQQALNDLQSEFSNKINKLEAMRSKANDLISIMNKESDSKLFGQIKNIAKGLKIAGKIGGHLGIAAQIIDAIKFQKDPQSYLYRLETGNELSPQGTIERDIQTRKLI